MKKATKVFVIIFIVFNLIISATHLNTVVAATGGIRTEGGYKEWDNTGNTQATLGGVEKTVKATSTQSSTPATSSIMSDFAMGIPEIVSRFMTEFIKPEYIEDVNVISRLDVEKFKSIIENSPDDIDEQWLNNIYKKFTILSLVLGYYDIFDIYFFDGVNESVGEYRTYNTILKGEVAKIYYNIQAIALVFSVFSLIYIGIRMAISVTASDKAKYKKLLRNWFVGFVLIFLLHYIAIFIMEISKLLQGLIVQIAQNLDIQTDFEYNIINREKTNYTNAGGFAPFTSVIIFWALVYYQLKFFIMYIFRQLEIAFLIIIAPIITVTYSLDKSVDGRSQIFNSWCKEITSEVFLQNLHCIAYLVFVISAGNIALKSPLLAIIFFASLSRVEKIVKNVFKIQGRGLRDIKIPFLNK